MKREDEGAVCMKKKTFNYNWTEKCKTIENPEITGAEYNKTQ